MPYFSSAIAPAHLRGCGWEWKHYKKNSPHIIQCTPLCRRRWLKGVHRHTSAVQSTCKGHESVNILFICVYNKCNIGFDDSCTQHNPHIVRRISFALKSIEKLHQKIVPTTCFKGTNKKHLHTCTVPTRGKQIYL